MSKKHLKLISFVYFTHKFWYFFNFLSKIYLNHQLSSHFQDQILVFWESRYCLFTHSNLSFTIQSHMDPPIYNTNQESTVQSTIQSLLPQLNSTHSLLSMTCLFLSVYSYVFFLYLKCQNFSNFYYWWFLYPIFILSLFPHLSFDYSDSSQLMNWNWFILHKKENVSFH